MIWFSSVKNGFGYDSSWDASLHRDSIQGYAKAMSVLSDHPRDGKDLNMYVSSCSWRLRISSFCSLIFCTSLFRYIDLLRLE